MVVDLVEGVAMPTVRDAFVQSEHEDEEEGASSLTQEVPAKAVRAMMPATVRARKEFRREKELYIL
jgi:hypothetical protein